MSDDGEPGLYVGYIPNLPGVHSQGETLDESRENLSEVLEMLLEDQPPRFETEFVGTQQIVVQAAVDTQDHAVSDRFIELLRPRRPN